MVNAGVAQHLAPAVRRTGLMEYSGRGSFSLDDGGGVVLVVVLRPLDLDGLGLGRQRLDAAAVGLRDRTVSTALLHPPHCARARGASSPGARPRRTGAHRRRRNVGRAGSPIHLTRSLRPGRPIDRGGPHRQGPGPPAGDRALASRDRGRDRLRGPDRRRPGRAPAAQWPRRDLVSKDRVSTGALTRRGADGPSATGRSFPSSM
jgi:hypothetical protein